MQARDLAAFPEQNPMRGGGLRRSGGEERGQNVKEGFFGGKVFLVEPFARGGK